MNPLCRLGIHRYDMATTFTTRSLTGLIHKWTVRHCTRCDKDAAR